MCLEAMTENEDQVEKGKAVSCENELRSPQDMLRSNRAKWRCTEIRLDGSHGCAIPGYGCRDDRSRRGEHVQTPKSRRSFDYHPSALLILIARESRIDGPTWIYKLLAEEHFAACNFPAS
jgi:hypothetical protein